MVQVLSADSEGRDRFYVLPWRELARSSSKGDRYE